MTKNIRMALTVLLLILFLAGIAGVLWSFMGYRQGGQEYSDAETLVGLHEAQKPESDSGQVEELAETVGTAEDADTEQPAEDPYARALSEANVPALQEINGDVIGWIQIPDTGLSYPLLQGTDNDYYLDHTWQKTYSAVGSIFMDERNSDDLSDFNTIIYGHNMNDGSMFGYLHQFKDESFLEAHPCLYLVDDASNSRTYRIFAAYEVSVSTAESYVISFAGEEDKQAFIEDCLALSAVDTGVIPTVEDTIVTLSTCTGRGHATRWVVQAVLES